MTEQVERALSSNITPSPKQDNRARLGGRSSLPLPLKNCHACSVIEYQMMVV